MIDVPEEISHLIQVPAIQTMLDNLLSAWPHPLASVVLPATHTDQDRDISLVRAMSLQDAGLIMIEGAESLAGDCVQLHNVALTHKGWQTMRAVLHGR